MYIFGWIANVLVFIYKLPQMYILWKVKQTTGLSLYSLCIQVTSYVLYIIYKANLKFKLRNDCFINCRPKRIIPHNPYLYSPILPTRHNGLTIGGKRHGIHHIRMTRQPCHTFTGVHITDFHPHIHTTG